MSDLVPQALDGLVEELRRYAAYQLEYGGADKRSDDVRLMSRAANRIEALEAENAALREQVAWRPIESAPKDGTQVLCYGVGRNDEPYMGVTSWLRGWPGALWPIAYMAYADCINPTHWRPLGAPPATDGAR